MASIKQENLWWHKGFSFEEQITKLLSNNTLVLENPEAPKVDAIVMLMNSKIYRKDTKKLIVIESFSDKELLSAPTEDILSIWLLELNKAAIKYPGPGINLVFSGDVAVHAGLFGFQKAQFSGITSNNYFVVFSGKTNESPVKLQLPLIDAKIETNVSAKPFSFAISYNTTGGIRKQFLAAPNKEAFDNWIKELNSAIIPWKDFGSGVAAAAAPSDEGKKEFSEEELRARAATSPMKNISKSASTTDMQKKKDKRKSFFA